MVVVTVLTTTKRMPQITKAASMGASHQNFDLEIYLKSSIRVAIPDLAPLIIFFIVFLMLCNIDIIRVYNKEWRSLS